MLQTVFHAPVGSCTENQTTQNIIHRGISLLGIQERFLAEYYLKVIHNIEYQMEDELDGFGRERSRVDQAFGQKISEMYQRNGGDLYVLLMDLKKKHD